jgi:glycosyltransferase involved in cell wall biosynthesis
MKILYVSAIELDVPGGPRTHVMEMVKEWDHLGHEVLLVTPPFHPKQANLPVRTQTYPFFGYSFLRRILSTFFLSAVLIRSLHRFAPQVLYERQMEFNPLVGMVCRIFKLPFFVEVNGLMAEDLETTGSGVIPVFLHKIIEKKEFRSSAGLCCTSPLLKKKICAKYKKISGNVCFIQNGINLDLFRPMRKRECRIKMGVDPDLKYAGFVGTFNHLHDSERVIESFKDTAEKIDDLRLIMAGDGPKRKSCQNLAAEYGLADKVIFTGALDYEDVPVIINCFDVGLVFASKLRLEREGVVAFKLFEMLACGCPVIAHYKDQEDYDLFSPFVKMVHYEDKRAVVDAMVDLFRDPVAASGMAKQALGYIQKNVSWGRSAAETLDFIKSKMAASRVPFE